MKKLALFIFFLYTSAHAVIGPFPGGSSGTGTGSVSSVFARSGDVTAQVGDYSTNLVSEGSNLYFTTARARSSFSATAPMVLSASGVISLPASTNSVNGYLTSSDHTLFNGLVTSKQDAITTGTTLQYFKGDLSLGTLNTAAVPESTNLYYTDARVATKVNSMTGTSSGNLVALESGGKLPAVDGSQLTNLPSAFTPYAVTTTGNASTTLATLALSASHAYTCKAIISGWRTDDLDTAHFELMGSVYTNVGGTCVFEDSTTQYQKRSDLNFSATWSCSTTNAILSVVGNIGKTIDWKGLVICESSY